MASKGEDYYVSQLITNGKPVIQSYPWFLIYYLKKLKDNRTIQYLKDIYAEETPFFLLLIWTTLASLCILFVSVPQTFLYLFSLLSQSIFGVFIPTILCFGIYLWAGVILKHLHHDISLRLCTICCIIFEIIIEIVEILDAKHFSYISLSLTILVTLFIIVKSRELIMEENKHVINFVVISSIFILRILNREKQILGWDLTVPTSLFYIYIFTGLAVSRLPSLRIPKSVGSLAPTPESYRDSRQHLLHDMACVPVIRQRRASSIEVATMNQNGVLNSQMKTRRKSLPALGIPIRKVSMSSMDLTILGEAHGMITDLLADSSLPLNVTGTLRIVADMISPLLQHSMHRSSSVGVPLLTVLEKNKNIEDEEQVKNQPDLKDDTPLSLKQRLQRNLGVSSRRMSSSYTTTTSATGMPTIDMEYHTKKSSAVNVSNNNNSPILTKSAKKQSHRSKSHAGILTSPERNLLKKTHSRSFSASQLSNHPKETPKSSPAEETNFKVEIERDKPIYFEGMDGADPSEDELVASFGDSSSLDRDDCATLLSAPLMGPSSRRKLSNSAYRLEEVKESPEREDITESSPENTNQTCAQVESEIEFKDINFEQETAKAQEGAIDSTSKNILETTTPESKRKLSDGGRNPPLAQRNVNLNIAEVAPVPKSSSIEDKSQNENLIIPSSTVRRKSSRELHMEYEIAVSRDVSGMLNKVIDWDFPIFELSERCNVLTQLAFRIFQLSDFFKTFQIAEVTFLKYFRALESGYHNIPYHNRIHAADVLHGVYYLTQHRIPGFNSSVNRKLSTAQDMNDDTDTQEDSDGDSEDDTNNYSYGCICDAVPDLELMGLYVAAAMHDFDHPGRTNAFLVATLNSKALLYNDRSVLENHHAAAAWSLLVTNPGLNFLSGLDPADFKRFRFIVIEHILSTDLKKHFDFLTEWNAKISDQGGGLNYTNEADRMLLGQMAIKIADISGPSKEWDLHYRWTERIVEEFYQQGEDERILGMATSAYMDRNDPKVPKLQSSFIKHLVQPLYVAYEKAGILPGEWVEVDDSDEEDDDDVENDERIIQENVQSNEESKGDNEKSVYKKKVIYNVMTDNIAKNHNKWLKIIEEEEGREKPSEDSKNENEENNIEQD